MRHTGTESGKRRRGLRGGAFVLPMALLVAVALLAAGAAAINAFAAGWLLRADAQATARAWAAELSRELGPELPALLARRPPSPVARDILEQAQRIGGVAAFRLYDAAGALAFAAGPPRPSPWGRSYIGAPRGTGGVEPAFHARARVPLLAGGREVGHAEADIDQSGKRALFRRTFLAMEAAMAALVLAAAALVGFGARRRLRERDADARAARALAGQDPLTGLPNRRALAEALDAALAPGATPTILCLVDLDGFKAVNDVHGHAAGDGVLRAAAERLRAAVRGDRDLVARLGGDEFAVLAFPGDTADAEPAAVASDLAARLVAAFTDPLSTEGAAAPLQLGASVGVALAPAHADAAGALQRCADLALYRAKAEGRGCFRLFEDGMVASARERSARLTALRAAIAAGAIEPHYQPVVDLVTGRLLGFEALARWHQPERGWVLPAEFVPLAEESGLIWPLTEHLLGRACVAAAAWPGGSLVLYFNVSPVQLRERGRLAALVATALEGSGLPARRLQLELTEGALTGDLATARQVLAELKATGVRLALDDFGTGHSGLRELQALPFDTLKLDRSFVRAAAEEDTAARRIVAAVVGLGQSLGLPVVAEGVEEEHDAEMLRVLGCDAAQGWLFGRPQPEAAAAALAAAAAPRAADALGTA